MKAVANFENGYMGKVLVKGVVNFIYGFFVKRGS